MYRTAAVSAMLPGVGLLTYFVNAAQVEDRLGINTTLLLTLAALQFLQGDALPKVPYLTLLDKYLLACFSFLVVLCVENGAVTSAAASAQAGIDRGFYIAACTVWLASNLAAFFYVQRRKQVIHRAEMSHIRKQNDRVEQSARTRKRTAGPRASRNFDAAGAHSGAHAAYVKDQ